MSDIMNRSVAGYHMLVILSMIDGKHQAREEKIIRNYMSENFSDEINFDDELDVILTLPAEDYAVHFNNAMNLFYMQSTQKERNHFLDLATRLVAADREVTKKENLFLHELYYAWEEETEE